MSGNNYPVFHGIALAGNAMLENLNLERLTADPIAPGAGRVWLNVTEKCVKYTTLDAGGAVVVKIIQDQDSVAAAVAAIQTSLDAEIAARIAGDNTEIAARQAAITALQTALNDEITNRTTAIAAEAAARATAIDAEAADRVSGDAITASTAADQLATEIGHRLSGDAALGVRIDDLQAEVDASQAGSGLNVDGTYTAPENTQYLGATTTLKTGLVALDTAVVNETTARTAADAAIMSALDNEAQLRADGDAANNAAIQAWVQTQIALDNTTDEARVAAEAALRIAKDDALQAELDVTQAAIGLATDGTLIPITGTNYLDGATSVFAGAFALDAQLKVVTDAVAAEEAARTTADNNFLTQLQTEATNRVATDDAQQQEINRIEAGAGLENDGSFATPTNSNYLNESISLKDSDYKLDAALKVVADQVEQISGGSGLSLTTLNDAIIAETAARQAGDSAEAAARIAADDSLAAQLAAEVTARTTADTALQTALTAETTARTNADASNAAAITAEIDRAQTAEASLQSSLATLTNSLNTEVTNRTTADTALQAQVSAINTNVSQEIARAMAAEEALELATTTLRTNINNGVFTLQSATAATTHNVAHGLNDPFVDVQVMVEGADGKYRNDYVSIEEVDGNTFNVYLSVARKIKVICRASKAV